MIDPDPRRSCPRCGSALLELPDELQRALEAAASGRSPLAHIRRRWRRLRGR